MRFKLFGKSGLRVSELCLGTMTFGKEFGWGSTKEESRAVLDAFFEAGGNFIDTANYYTKGTSETYIGEFLQGRREKCVLATKYSLSKDPKDPNASGNHRKNMVQAVNKSLERLKTDYIDLYWIHAWDFLTPIEEVMRGLDDLVAQGKILYVGISDTPAWIVSRANTLAEWRGWSPFIGLQLEYSLVERTIEPEYFPMAQSLDMAIAAWSPLGMGTLTGKYLDNPSAEARFKINEPWGGRYLNEQNQKIVKKVVEIGKETGRSPAQVALSWVRAQSPQMIPIIGAKNLDQLKDNMDCLSLTLSQEQLNSLNEISKPPQIFPHDFLKQEGVRNILYGDHVIENHRI